MTPERLAEIELRADAVRAACLPAVHQKRIRQSQADIPELIAEVKRLKCVVQEACGLMTEAITEIVRLRGAD